MHCVDSISLSHDADLRGGRQLCLIGLRVLAGVLHEEQQVALDVTAEDPRCGLK